MRKLIERNPLLTVFGLTFLCLLPILIGRDFTPSNELRYLSIADEALRDGNVFAFYNHGIPYADKPPLYLWIVIACKWLLGHHSMFVLSLFSLIPAYLIIYIMDKWLRSEHVVSPATRAATALMMLSTAMFAGSAVVLRMDMLMTLFIVLALWSFYKLYRHIGNERRERWLLPLWIFLALFSKGPVGFFMPVLVIVVFLALRRELNRFSQFLGWKAWALMFGLFALWILGVWIDGGTPYIKNLLLHQTVGRAVNSFSHDKPFLYYFLHIWWIAAPWIFLSAYLVWNNWETRRSSVTEHLFLTTIIVTFLMLSSFSAKLGVYMLPILPMVVYLIPVIQSRTAKPVWQDKALTIGVLTFFALAFAAGLFIARINPYIGYGPLCKAIPADATVSTLYVPRPENMDVYLGHPVTDYARTPYTFLATLTDSTSTATATATDTTSNATTATATDTNIADYTPNTAGNTNRPRVLIVKTAKITPGTPLATFTSSHPTTPLGPYTLVTY